ncbi:hypothetical protein [Amycolatopsis sp. lyj-346]|uniref:hypothetical protein n=1 Tax=Amycolatopsis sp. lyj-346 TaxID=2789289 RepID=UPI00397C1033
MSMLPVLFLSTWTFVLVVSGAWSGRPVLSRMAHELTGITVSEVAWLLLGTLVLALFLHPLQLAMTKVLEGYWGSSRIAAALLRSRITHHRKRFNRLSTRREKLEQRRNRVLTKLLVGRYLRKLADDPATAEDPARWASERLKRELENLLFSTQAYPASGAHAAMASIPVLLAHYPDPDRMMPTRLGNALRSAEDSIGRQYALDAVRTTPYIALIAPEPHLNYLQDTRQQLDTSVRLCVVALLATVEAVGFLFTDGWWLLASLGPYFLAYIAYRASIAAAIEYMEMVRTVLDLNRFKLYESLHLEQPDDTDTERTNNVKLMSLLSGDETVTLHYKHPVAGTPSTGDSPPTPPRTP